MNRFFLMSILVCSACTPVHEDLCLIKRPGPPPAATVVFDGRGAPHAYQQNFADTTSLVRCASLSPGSAVELVIPGDQSSESTLIR